MERPGRTFTCRWENALRARSFAAQDVAAAKQALLESPPPLIRVPAIARQNPYALAAGALVAGLLVGRMRVLIFRLAAIWGVKTFLKRSLVQLLRY